MNRTCGIDVNTILTLCVTPNYNALQIKRNLRGNTMSIDTIQERKSLSDYLLPYHYVPVCLLCIVYYNFLQYKQEHRNIFLAYSNTISKNKYIYFRFLNIF